MDINNQDNVCAYVPASASVLTADCDRLRTLLDDFHGLYVYGQAEENGASHEDLDLLADEQLRLYDEIEVLADRIKKTTVLTVAESISRYDTLAACQYWGVCTVSDIGFAAQDAHITVQNEKPRAHMPTMVEEPGRLSRYLGWFVHN